MKNKQGLFHLVSILCIPTLLVTIFLLENVYASVLLGLVFAFAIWFLFFKPHQKP